MALLSFKNKEETAQKLTLNIRNRKGRNQDTFKINEKSEIKLIKTKNIGTKYGAIGSLIYITDRNSFILEVL